MYYAKVNFFVEGDMEDAVEHILIAKKEWNEAMQVITNTYNNINSIEMEWVNDSADVVYVKEDLIEDMIMYNTY